jgi:hypothetical protein
VDPAFASVLAHRPEAPRKIKFALRSFLVRPIEPSIGELLFFVLYHFSCGSTTAASAMFAAHEEFMDGIGAQLRDDVDNWLSLVPHLVETREEAQHQQEQDQEQQQGTATATAAAGVRAGTGLLSASEGGGAIAVSVSDLSSSVSLPPTPINSPVRTSDKPTQSMEAYVADILTAKLAMLCNISRIPDGRERIFTMQEELYSLSQLIVMYVELPDVKVVGACLLLFTALAPMVHLSVMKEKTVHGFIVGAVSAALNAAARVEDLFSIDQVRNYCSCICTLFYFFVVVAFFF